MPTIEKKVLNDIEVDKIFRNPENPRLFFRQQELDELTESIRRLGVQVPISVYQEGNKYILIDGERRWKCSVKLNRKTIPAIIQTKPDLLTNLLLMFNIHALREQWDLLTIAIKLPRVIDLFKDKNDRDPNEKDLSEETGLTRSIIRRCRALMQLPQHHIDSLKAELKKPKNQQKISEDMYIEMERALKTVSRSIPELIPNESSKEQIRQVLIKKYKSDIVKNIVDFRKIAKIARAESVNADVSVAKDQLRLLFNHESYSIDTAYTKSVSTAYEEKNLQSQIRHLIEDLSGFETENLDEDVMDLLHELDALIRELMEGRS